MYEQGCYVVGIMLEGAQNINTHDVFRQTGQFYGRIGDPPNRMVTDANK